MIITVRNVIDYLAGKPKKLFLIDSFGAILTAFFLFVVLRNFNEYFGMPKILLTYLSVIAVCFCIYSTTCYFFLKNYWTLFISIISIANLLYCILTMGLLIFYYPHLTIIGLTYFLLEIAIICKLIYVELHVAATIKKSGMAESC